MADDQHRLALVTREPAHDGVIVGKPPIAVDLGELGEQAFDVVEHDGRFGWRATSTRCHGVSRRYNSPRI